MDIDDFLDRELADLGLLTDKAEKSEEKPEIIEVPQIKGDFEQEETEPSSLFDSIKDKLNKGNLEEAERLYLQLWHIFQTQKLNWNKDIYGQLYSLSRQFSSVISQAYNEAKRKSDRIHELMSRARVLLREGKKEMPLKLYNEIQEINASIPNVFFEEKRRIGEKIMDFYREIKNTTDNELLKRVYTLLQEINQLIGNIDISMSRNDSINAIVNYNKCIELYIQIPEGFLRHKNPIGMKILDIYKNLSINTEISNLQRQLPPVQFPKQTSIPLNIPRQMPYREVGKKEPLGVSRIKKAYNQKQELLDRKKELQKELLNKKKELLDKKKKRAKENIEKGFYNEAVRDIDEALAIEPKDVTALVYRAKLKTLQ